MKKKTRIKLTEQQQKYFNIQALKKEDIKTNDPRLDKIIKNNLELFKRLS